MKLEIMLDNKNGNVWDLSQVVSDLTWSTVRIGKPGSLDFTLVTGGPAERPDFQIRNGDIVRVMKDGVGIFYGYVFELGYDSDESVKVKAYDQIRYLLSSNFYAFSGKTATDIVKKIAGDVGLKTGKLADTKYVIPKMIHDNKKLLDIIYTALDYTLVNGYGNFYLYDDFGALSLGNTSSLAGEFFIGEGSLMYGYDYTKSIDKDTYNVIKVAQDDKTKGVRNVYAAKDSANIAQWGVLILYEKVDDNLNEAQAKQILDRLATLKNRETRSLRINALGDLRVRAGSYVRILIERLGINQPMLVESCSHKFEGDHTMSLELKVI